MTLAVKFNHDKIWPANFVSYAKADNVNLRKRSQTMSERNLRQSEAASNTEEQLESVIADVIRNCESGPPPNRGEILTCHPKLADNLQRFPDGRPILDRPVDNIEQFWRWNWHHPQVAALSAAVMLLTISIAIGSTVGMVAISEQQRDHHLATWWHYLHE